jgi:hypothetical protein
MKLKTIAVRAGLAVGLTLVPLTVVAQAATAGPTTLYVATSGTNTDNNCQNSLTPCQTITFALTQAASGATIKVQAGIYNEQVKITQPVTILGAGSTQTVIEPSAVPAMDADTDSVSTLSYIVDASGTAGVNLEDLGINGSAASSTFTSCGQGYVGVYYHDASGSMTNDTVSAVELPPALFGCQAGLGVYVTTDSSSVTTSSLTMKADNVNTYDKNGITCDDPGTVCTIKSTTVTGIGSTPLIAQNGIQIWAASATLTSDVVTDNTYDGPSFPAAGILIGNPYRLVLKHNQVTHNDTDISLLQDQSGEDLFCGNPGIDCTNPSAPGATFLFAGNHASDATNADNQVVGSEYGDGIDLDSVTTGTVLKHNVADNDPAEGVSLFGTTAVTANANTLRSDFNGFLLDLGSTAVTANANTLKHNIVSASGNDGFLATSNSGGNNFFHNSSLTNAVLDAQDQSTGLGTAGTANLWEGNNCQTSDPSGLCRTMAGPNSRSAADHGNVHAVKHVRRGRHSVFR